MPGVKAKQGVLLCKHNTHACPILLQFDEVGVQNLFPFNSIYLFDKMFSLLMLLNAFLIGLFLANFAYVLASKFWKRLLMPPSSFLLDFTCARE
jgi:hypothetical protein